MPPRSSTTRIRRLERARRLIAGAIHLPRMAAVPALRGQRDHTTLLSAATYSPWRTDVEFRRVYGEVGSATLLDEMRLYELWRLAGQVGHLEGDAIEVGCWRGGAGCMIATRIAAQAPEARTFLCDTFSGVVKAGAHDPTYVGGEHADASAAGVEALARRLGLDSVRVLTGIFPEETGPAVEDRRFRFAHIDLDVYQGSRDAFTWLVPRLVVGAVVVFDDYSFALTGGVRAFVDELEGHEDFVVVHNLNGHAVVVRRKDSGNGAVAR